MAERLHEHGDVEAARQLVLANSRFVIYIARSYSGYGLSEADLIQEGNIGLMKAVKRFNPSTTFDWCHLLFTGLRLRYTSSFCVTGASCSSNDQGAKKAIF